MFKQRIYRLLSHIISPPYCTYCKKFLAELTTFCDNCEKSIRPIVSAKMLLTKNYEMTIFSVSSYQDPIKRLILAKGWSDYQASVQLANIVWQKSLLSLQDFDLLVPIPLHWTRYAWRGYNQAEVIAWHLSRLSGKPMISCLKRTRRSLFQSQLGTQERAINVKGIFQFIEKDNHKIEGKRVVLVDDLMTTGATLRSAAEVIAAMKPTKIIAAVACRVV